MRVLMEVKIASPAVYKNPAYDSRMAVNNQEGCTSKFCLFHNEWSWTCNG